MTFRRIVHFTKDRPDRNSVIKYVGAYMNGCGRLEEITATHWHIILPEEYSDPEREHPDPTRGPDRWIEIDLDGPENRLRSVDVLTRSMDPLTQSIADGLAASMRRKWRCVEGVV